VQGHFRAELRHHPFAERNDLVGASLFQRYRSIADFEAGSVEGQLRALRLARMSKPGALNLKLVAPHWAGWAARGASERSLRGGSSESPGPVNCRNELLIILVLYRKHRKSRR
jgi:hypothetical protein